MISVYSQVKEKDVAFKIADFSLLTKTAVGVSVANDGLGVGLKTAPVFITGSTSTVRSLFYEGGQVYYYQDGALYSVGEDSQSVYTAKDDGELIVKEINYRGKASLLVFEKGEGGVVLSDGNSYNASLPDAEFIEVLGLQIYTAKGREISFGDCYNLSGFSDRVITMPRSAGDIKGLCAYGKKLLVFCQNDVYELTAFGEEIDYLLQRKTSIDLDVKSGTVKRLGNKVVFVSGNSVCYYNDGSVSVIKTAFDLSKFTVVDNASALDNLYLLPITVAEKSGYSLYAIDLASGREYVESISSPCIADGGYLCLDNQIRVISQHGGEATNDCSWESLPIDFNLASNKNLSEIALRVENPIKLAVTGNFGQKIFGLKSGLNLKKVNLTSDEFCIKFYGGQTVVKEINLKYRKTGEL